jgi:hypothetical protein
MFFRNLFNKEPAKPASNHSSAETKLDKKSDTFTESKAHQPMMKKAVVIGYPDKAPKLPSDPLNKIVNSTDLTDKDAVNFAQVCRGFYHGTKPALLIRKLEMLAHYVIVEPSTPNIAKVIATLNAEPTLLLDKIPNSKDRVGRRNKTIFQLAYGAGDADCCLAMKSAFIKLYKGDEKVAIAEMERQRQGMLESKEEEKRKEAESKAALAELFKVANAAISAEQFNHGRDDQNRLILSQETLAAIETFREGCAELQSKMIEGMHFRDNTLLEAFAVYTQAAAGWGYDYNRCALFEDGLLSTIESDLPANVAQKVSQGLYYLHKKNKPEPARRSLTLRDGESNFYEVVRGPSSDFALLGRCVDISFGSAERSQLPGGGAMVPAAHPRLISILISNKNNRLAELMQSIQIAAEVSACNSLKAQ